MSPDPREEGQDQSGDGAVGAKSRTGAAKHNSYYGIATARAQEGQV